MVRCSAGDGGAAAAEHGEGGNASTSTVATVAASVATGAETSANVRMDQGIMIMVQSFGVLSVARYRAVGKRDKELRHDWSIQPRGVQHSDPRGPGLGQRRIERHGNVLATSPAFAEIVIES